MDVPRVEPQKSDGSCRRGGTVLPPADGHSRGACQRKKVGPRFQKAQEGLRPKIVPPLANYLILLGGEAPVPGTIPH